MPDPTVHPICSCTDVSSGEALVVSIMARLIGTEKYNMYLLSLLPVLYY